LKTSEIGMHPQQAVIGDRQADPMLLTVRFRTWNAFGSAVNLSDS